MDTKHIAFDCETGGLLAKDCSLLTVYFAVCDKDLNVLSELPLAIKPDNNAPYQVTAGAMDVNKINLIEHDKIAIAECDARQRLYNYLKMESDGGKIKLVPLGQNVTFDIAFVNAHLLNKSGWDYFCSYRVMDTGIIGQFLRSVGLIPPSVTGSLGSYAKFYGIKPQGPLHDAKTDTLLTIAVMKAMINQIRDLKDRQYPQVSLPK